MPHVSPQKIIQTVLGSFFGVIFLACTLGILTPSYARAATLSIATSRTTYAIGDTVVARVYVGSAGEATNAVEGTIVLPSVVDFSSVTIDGSILSFWVQKPSYAGASRSIYFSGVAMNPGFTGDRGLILTIYARAQSAGSDAFSISNGSVLANDGQWTQILTSVANAQVAVQALEVTPPPPSSGLLVISSTSHPDQNKWYANNDVTLAWPKDSSVVAVRLVYDKNKATLPAVTYEPPIWTKTIADSADGTWYFRVQEKTSVGWGSIGTYRVNIDTAPPRDFAVTAQKGIQSDDPHPVILFGTTDDLSGVDHYLVAVDGQTADAIPADKSGNPIVYALPLQTPGQKTVTVTAVDAAGNSTRSSLQIVIDPIGAPVIDEYPLQSTVGDPVVIRGHATSGESIVLTLQKEGADVQTQSVSTTPDGTFALLWPKNLEQGTYGLSAYAVDGRGAQSNPTAPVSLMIQQQLWMRMAISWLMYGSAGIVVVLFLIGAAFVVLLLLRRLRRLEKEVGLGKRKTDETLHQALLHLAAHVRNHVDILERTKSQRRLSEEETALLLQLQEDVADIEKKIGGALNAIDQEKEK